MAGPNARSDRPEERSVAGFYVSTAGVVATTQLGLSGPYFTMVDASDGFKEKDSAYPSMPENRSPDETRV